MDAVSQVPAHAAERTDYPRTTPAALRRAVERWPGAEAIVDGERRWTFADYGRDVTAGACGLIAAGIVPGDRVAIWAPNSAEFAIAAMSTYCAGAVVVPLNTRLTAIEAAELIRRARASAVFTVGDFLGRSYLASLAELGVLDEVSLTITVNGPATAGAMTLDQLAASGARVSEDEARARAEAVTGADVSDILFTSGTTGRPKGAMLRHDASARGYTEYGRSLGLRPGDRMIGIAPFFHCFGLKGIVLTAVLYGAAILPVPAFDVLALADLIGREQATVLQGSPTIFLGLLDHPGVDRSRLSSVRVAGPGSMGFSAEGFARVRDQLGITQFAPGYALTESTAVGSRCYWFDDFETVSATSGRPAPGVAMRIVDGRGRDLPPGSDGEILISGYNVMSGYFEDPAATAEAIDGDGWLHTGDIGRFDARGRLTVTDRKKDMFLVGGFNTYPAEIERVLSLHRPVAEVAVIGVPDERLGQVGKAFVVPRDPPTFELDALAAFARERLANYKVPRYWEVTGDLPRNASGKVRKFMLRERPTSLPRPGGDRRADNLAGDLGAQDLAGTLDHPGHPQVAEPAFQRDLPRHAHRAEELHHLVHDPEAHLGAVQLGDGGLQARILALVVLPGRLPGEPAAGVDLDPRVGDGPLDRLAGGQRGTEGLPLPHPLGGQAHRLFRYAHGPRRVPQPATHQPVRGEQEPGSVLADEIPGRDTHLVEEDFGRPVIADHRQRARRESRLAGLHHEGADPLVGPGVDHAEPRPVGVGDP
ncbi:MAG TPA: AMP-binding protein [Streptosporangiaceae bacterium]|nr:AMP-binding protein [Streptosporangiaceae bacterium]